MNCKRLLHFLLIPGLYLGSCRHPEIDGGATKKTFVLSDTMLKTIRIDTASFRPVQMELHFSGRVAGKKTIARKSDIVVDVASASLPKAREGYEAEISTSALPEKVFYGKVDGVFISRDTTTGRLSIRLDSPESKLQPEMFTQVVLHWGDGNNMIAVPGTAIIADHNRNFVLVFKDKYNIQVREVETYTTSGEITYISKGLDAGENVISGHQQQIYDALSDN